MRRQKKTCDEKKNKCVCDEKNGYIKDEKHPEECIMKESL